MPDKRTTELTAIDVVTGTDLVMVVDDPAGSAVSKKATVTQVLVNTAKINAPNTFTGDQTIDGDLVVTGEINPVRLVAQLAKVDALEGRVVGNTTGSRTLLSKSLIAGLSMRHDEVSAQATITVGNYDTQIYQPMLMQQESLRISTGLSPVIAEHLRVHPSGGVTIGTVHTADPGVGILIAGGLGTTPLNASQLTTGTVVDARLSANVLKFTGGYPGGSTTFLRADGTFSAPSPAAHQATHQQGGSDPVNVKTLAGFPGDGGLFLNGQGSFNIPPAPANVAYKNVDNSFSVTQTLVGLTVSGQTTVQHVRASGTIRAEGARGNPSGTGGGIELFFQNGQGYIHGYDMTAGAYTPLYLYGTGVTIGKGNFTVVDGYVQSSGVMYPGRVDTTASQLSWYIGGHASYGLYCNTGFYIQGTVWSGTSISAPSGAFTGAVTANTLTSTAALTCGSIECGAHMRWAGGNYWSWDGANAFLQGSGNILLNVPGPGNLIQVNGLLRIAANGPGATLVNDEAQNFRIDCHGPLYYFRGDTGSAYYNSFFPSPPNSCYLGNPTYPWYAVHAYLGTIQPSDASIKSSIRDSDLGLAFVEKLRPRRYTFNHDPTREHIGFTTQEVEAAMEGRPFAVVVHPDKALKHDGPSGLNYAGFVPILTKAVQELSARLRTLENAWNKMEEAWKN